MRRCHPATRPLGRVLKLVERDIDRSCQQLIVPEVELEDWTANLPGV
jgi:hypothetical protein